MSERKNTTVRVKVLRQDGPDRPETQRWQEFEVPRTPRMTVDDVLRAIRENPVDARGQRIAPVAFESGCQEEACGACTLLVNGRVAPACAVFVEEASPKGQAIELRPLSKFPVVRDLVTDRSRTNTALQRVQAWIDLDPSRTLGAAPPSPVLNTPRQSATLQSKLYTLTSCTNCSACLEACPQFSKQGDFVGALVLAQVQLQNERPSGSANKPQRLASLMQKGGVADCGKAQNCVEVCPQSIPLVDSIQELSRDTSKRLVWNWLLGSS